LLYESTNYGWYEECLGLIDVWNRGELMA